MIACSRVDYKIVFTFLIFHNERQVAPDAYNLFATAATDGVVSLWDLRTPSVSSRYCGHVNRRENVECAISPCIKYLAVGSEDRAARIVDLRTCREIARIPAAGAGQGQHKDVVTCVAFNPLFPQVATCSFDGTIKFFIDPYVDQSQPGL
jgi:WD40 repeat protein